jgi:dihydroorotate dehydrogenase
MLVTIGARIPALVASGVLNKFYRYEDLMLETEVFGIKFPNPVGLAAGFDKNAKLLHLLPAFGFGFIEVGAVTLRAQEGNPKPRLFHIGDKRALVNRMGFNNDGLGVIAQRLKKRKGSRAVGANIGKNKDTPTESAADDYALCMQKLHGIADYMVVNVSSPNTPGLRNLQQKAFLRKVLETAPTDSAIFVKISPELSGTTLDEIISVVQERPRTGIIATNTLKIEQGGVSGEPLREPSTDLIRWLYKKSHGKIPIIGVGGIFSGKNAYEKITAGASLVQLYTGLIYEGPGLVKRIKKDLVQLLKAGGFTNITQAIGTKA